MLGELARAQQAGGFDPQRASPLRCSLAPGPAALDKWLSNPAIERCRELPYVKPTQAEIEAAKAFAAEECRRNGLDAPGESEWQEQLTAQLYI